MAKASTCPQIGELQELASGELPPAAVEKLVSHVETCPACMTRVQTLTPADTLVQALGRVRDLPEEADAAVLDQLIAGLKAVVVPQTVRVLGGEGRPAEADADATGLGDSAAAEEGWNFLAPPQAPDEIGRLGPYRVLEVLGRGGMGIVFRAEDSGLQRVVALKAMLPSLSAQKSARQRFLLEAQAAARLRHDHIVTIHQVGEDRGIPFLAMEFLQGESLAARLRRERPLPLAEVLRVGREVAEGLAAAHDAELIHRDIKPANVWLESRTTRHSGAAAPRVKILDFGLARATNDSTSLTKSGMILGTPGFMAPEQARGGSVDVRCDLFSLGCLLYVMTTGQLPFTGPDNVSTLMAVALHEPPAPHSLNPRVPLELSDLIRRLLAKDPEKRPQSASEVAAALRALESNKDGTAILASGEGSPSSVAAASAKTILPGDNQRPTKTATPRSPGKRRVVVAVLAAGLLAAAAAAVFFLPAGNGTIRVEINDDATEVVLTRTGAKIKTTDGLGEVVVSPGEQKLKVKHGDLELETDQFVLKKGQTVTVKVEWLKDRLVVVGKDDGTKLGSVSRPPSPRPETAKGPAWKPTPEQLRFIDAVALLPENQRGDAVKRKLIEVAGPIGINGNSVYPQIEFEPKGGLPTGWVYKHGYPVEAIWPILALPSLQKVEIDAPISDCSFLAQMPLTDVKLLLVLDDLTTEEMLKGIKTLKTVNGRPAAELWAAGAKVRKNIEAMKGKGPFLPAADRKAWLIEQLRLLYPELKNEEVLYEERGIAFAAPEFVKDVTPLRGVGVTALGEGNPIRWDVRPVVGTGVQDLRLQGCALTDLSPLKGMDVKRLLFIDSGVTDLRPLAGMPLEYFGYESGKGPRKQLTDLSPLKGAPLKSFRLMGTGVKSLDGLERSPLTKVEVLYSDLEDVKALKGMETLTALDLGGTKVSNISPLAGLSLTSLALSEWVLDLSPLKGSKIQNLRLGGWRADLSPLKGVQIESLSVPFRLYYDADEKLIRSLGLKQINGQSTDDFWKGIETRRKEEEKLIASMAKVPLEEEALKKALWDAVGQYPSVKIADGAVVEAAINDGNGPRDRFAVFLAFPKLRKLTLNMLPADFSPLLKLPLLEELECRLTAVSYNLPVLRAMPKLKTINGKPAKEILDAVTATPQVKDL